MKPKKKSGKRNSTENLLLLTAIIELITAVITLINAVK